MTTALSAFATAMAMACATPTPPPAPRLGCAKTSGQVASASLKQEAMRQVTFYSDILPILASSENGSAYKCTTCHAHYSEPNGLNNVNEVDRIIDALQSGRMPRGGDRVPDARIELIRTWQLQGFQNGSASDTPASLPAIQDAATGNGSSNPCAGSRPS